MIAIDVEMPSCCDKCGLFDGVYGCRLKFSFDEINPTVERYSNCPLAEIITCKDCIHRDEYGCRHGHPNCKDNFYCADGERRE